jgi:hypothetical protein
LEKIDYKLNGAWLKGYKIISRADKGKSYVSQIDKDIDIEHDTLIKMELLEFQKLRRFVDNTGLAEISSKSLEEARSVIIREARELNLNCPPMIASVLGMETHVQEYVINDTEVKLIGMGNLFTDSLTDSEIDILKIGLRKFEVEYYEGQSFLNIVLYSIDARIVTSPDYIDFLNDSYTQKAKNSIREHLIKIGNPALAKIIPKYPIWKRVLDYIKINF